MFILDTSCSNSNRLPSFANERMIGSVAETVRTRRAFRGLFCKSFVPISPSRSFPLISYIIRERYHLGLQMLLHNKRATLRRRRLVIHLVSIRAVTGVQLCSHIQQYKNHLRCSCTKIPRIRQGTDHPECYNVSCLMKSCTMRFR
jgi:hypothetical protein